MKHLLLMCITTLVWISASAQKQNAYYFKNNGQQVAIKDSADFIRIIREPDGATNQYAFTEYYITGKQKRLGHTSTMQPLTLEGQVLEYYPSGKIKQVAMYKGGQTEGKVFENYPNGKPYRTFEITMPKPTRASRAKPIYPVPEKTILYVDTNGKEQVTAGQGRLQEYNKDFTEITAEGNVQNGLKQGEWRGYKNGKEFYVEIFNEGRLVSGTSYDSLGTKYTYKEDGDALPMFTNGVTALAGFIQKNFVVPPSIAKKYKGVMRIEIGFTVEKDGRLTNIFPKNISIPGELNDEAIRVFEKSPPWMPAFEHGQPVQYAYTMPISVTLQ